MASWATFLPLGSQERARFLVKFLSHGRAKVDRMVELLQEYTAHVRDSSAAVRTLLWFPCQSLLVLKARSLCITDERRHISYDNCAPGGSGFCNGSAFDVRWHVTERCYDRVQRSCWFGDASKSRMYSWLLHGRKCVRYKLVVPGNCHLSTVWVGCSRWLNFDCRHLDRHTRKKIDEEDIGIDVVKVCSSPAVHTLPL